MCKNFKNFFPDGLSMKEEKMSATLASVLDRLFAVIESRKSATGETSYTARLLEAGAVRIGEKIEEEAGEVAEAALEAGAAHLVHEIADLLFHVFVMASCKDITPDRIALELERRFGKSGLQEKAERPKKETE
jgi:phosphoribosyl-ATP pyrophosphohydrolase